MSNVKPLAASVVFTVVGLALIGIGLEFFGTVSGDLVALLIFGAAIALLAELGFSTITNLGNKTTIEIWIAVALILVLFLFGLSIAVGFVLPNIITGAAEFLLVVSGIWLLVEGWRP